MESMYPSVYPTLAPEHLADLKSRHVLMIDRHVAEAVLTPEACIDVLEDAFKQEAQGLAANRTKTNIHLRSNDSKAPYRYCSMEGGIGGMGVVAIRIKSDMTTPRIVNGVLREDWYSCYPGLFFGMVLLFSSENGALLAMMQDAHIQHMRVAATHAVATKYLAREDSKVLGILGSGGMAWTHAWTLPKIRPIERIKIYSPNVEHRQQFATKASAAFGIPVEATDDAESVVRQSDIVAGCTNTLDPVIFGEWVDPGTHLILCKRDEPDESAYRKVDKYFVYESPPGVQGVAADNLFTYAAEPEFIRSVKGSITPGMESQIHEWVPQGKQKKVSDLVAGLEKGRENPQEITCTSSEGTGVQFAAVGLKVYEGAVERGLGNPLPLEWFLQDVTN